MTIAHEPALAMLRAMIRIRRFEEACAEDYAAGKFPGGQTVTFGLKEDGVGLSEMKYTKDKIPADILKKVDEAKEGILSGKIKVWNVVDQGYPSWMK